MMTPVPPASLTDFFRDKGTSHALGKHTSLWQPGEIIGALYLVETGLLRLFDVRADGTTTTLLSVGRGGLIGVHPLLGVVGASAGAEAILPSCVRKVSFGTCCAWLEQEAPRTLQAWFFEDLRRHLANTYARLELANASASERLARVLLSLDAAGLLASAQRRQLAELANLTVETTVRTLHAWEQMGTLKSRRLETLSLSERSAFGALLSREQLTLPYG